MEGRKRKESNQKNRIRDTKKRGLAMKDKISH